jgi:oxepin-CoA hydrolase/3-oxo-5,6-dehydrosuberyl-CoA semialdehyde dehydrogenase
MMPEKFQFITLTFSSLLPSLPGNKTGIWGKMNAQQMVEHVADFYKISSGKLVFPVQTPGDMLPKYKAFLMSDKEFRENTRGPENIVPEEPFPGRNSSFANALAELENETKDFVEFFKNNPGITTPHPVFGELNFEEWVLLHYKHVTHHARQFGLC